LFLVASLVCSAAQAGDGGSREKQAAAFLDWYIYEHASFDLLGVTSMSAVYERLDEPGRREFRFSYALHNFTTQGYITGEKAKQLMVRTRVREEGWLSRVNDALDEVEGGIHPRDTTGYVRVLWQGVVVSDTAYKALVRPPDDE
jgi:hypothetical protein